MCVCVCVHVCAHVRVVSVCQYMCTKHVHMASYVGFYKICSVADMNIILLLGHNIDLLTPSLKFILQTLLDQQTQFKMCTINKDEGLTPFGGSKLNLIFRNLKHIYLSSIRNPKLRQLFTKLRISDHNLMIEIE